MADLETDPVSGVPAVPPQGMPGQTESPARGGRTPGFNFTVAKRLEAQVDAAPRAVTRFNSAEMLLPWTMTAKSTTT